MAIKLRPKNHDKGKNFIVTDSQDRVMKFFTKQLNSLGAFCYLGDFKQVSAYTKKEAEELVKISTECRRQGGVKDFEYQIKELKNW